MLSIGIDIVGLTRFTKLIQWSPKLAELLTLDARQIRGSDSDALRFATFEAFWKALKNLQELHADKKFANQLNIECFTLIKEFKYFDFENLHNSQHQIGLLRFLHSNGFQVVSSGSHDNGFAIAVVVITSK